MAEIQLIKGAANGNPSDSLPTMYDKVNKNTANINNQVVNHEGRLGTAEAAVSNHGSRISEAEAELITQDNRISTIIAHNGDGTKDTELIDARGGQPLLSDRLDATDAQLADKVTYKKVYISEQGLPGDGTFRTISSVFPSATLAQVQALNPVATLSNAADWYVIQKLIDSAEESTTIIVDGFYVVDLPIILNKNFFTLEGKTPYRWQWGIRQIGINQSLLKVKGSYQAIRNLLLSGALEATYKSLHGIEIFGEEVQTDHLQVENCYIQSHGGNGIHSREGSLILSRFKDCIVYNCYDNGIYFHHTPVTQQNALMFDNVDTYNNGLEKVGDTYQRYTSPDPSRGHGMSVSGVAISVIGGDSSENASGGVHIHEGYYTEGLTVTGRFFEHNLLANVYNEGRKAFNFVGNYMYPGFSSLGNNYNKYPMEVISGDVAYEVLALSRHLTKPIQTYTHTTNKVTRVTAIDSGTNEFVCAGHGLSNGASLYPVMDEPAGTNYSANVYPNGLYLPPEGGFKVINATADMFQVSLTTGGTPVTITGVGDVYDLPKWHFESDVDGMTVVSYVTNLAVGKQKRIKALIRGRFLANQAPAYILPVATGVGVAPNWVTAGEAFDYPMTQLTADLHLDLTVRVDCTHNITLEIAGTAVSTSAEATGVKVRSVQILKRFVRLIESDGADGLMLQQCYPANGTTIDLFLDA